MKLLREPLFQFLLIGAALFAVFSFAGRWTPDAENQIQITSAQIAQLIKGFRIDFNREPTPQDVQKLITDYVREEVLFREAKKRGLDQEDSGIRQRLRNRMETFNANVVTESPTDQQLQAYLEAHADRFRKPDGTLPAIDDIRPTLTAAYVAGQRQAAADKAYEALKSHYRIKIDPVPADALQPATATAPTAEAS
jgi:hypothetical protein